MDSVHLKGIMFMNETEGIKLDTTVQVSMDVIQDALVKIMKTRQATGFLVMIKKEVA